VSQTLSLFLEWIESGFIATEIRQSTWLYPFIEIIHLFGIVLVAGGAAMFDIQLLASRLKRTPGPDSFLLLSWSRRGLILAIPSGILLFSTNAISLSHDPVFAIKLILLLIAALNAWLFHKRVYLPYYHESQLIFRWNLANVNAIVSLILWTSIIACGRLLAY